MNLQDLSDEALDGLRIAVPDKWRQQVTEQLN